MASGITTAFWGMTINNYDESDLAMVQHGYPDYMRELVYTLEKGEEGTPHIQAFIKLQRQQRMSFVRKLFPRGHFTPLTSDVYVQNTKKYAQKLDETAVAAAVHKFNDPTHTLESVIKKMVIKIREDENLMEEPDLDVCKTTIEKQMVKEDYRYAKIFVSSTYSQMWKKFGYEMFENISATHTTHTHSDDKLSRGGGITQDADWRSENDETEYESDATGQEVSNDYEEGSSCEDEGYDESSSDECSESSSQSQE